MQSVDPHLTETDELARVLPASTSILDLYEFDILNVFLITFNTCMLIRFKNTVYLTASISCKKESFPPVFKD
jgi:hypothetical protein